MEADKLPEHLKGKVNPVKKRILFLSPSVVSGEEREGKKEDFENLSNANIGVGGFGRVFKVKHKVSGKIYAIKVIPKAKILENELAEQIKLEVKIMYKLDHPNIVKLYNHFEDDDNFYLVLELIPKGQLYTRLKMLGRLDERVAAQLIREVVSAVEYLHAQSPPIIHRDIKPENILLDANEAAKLCDFGWSNFFNQERKRMTYCGTPEYLAPEMIKQAGHDESLDLWNIGVLMFELLTGKPPFEGAGQKELFESIVKVKINYPKDFPKFAKDLINRLLKSDPKERIKVPELKEHPWFKSNIPLRPLTWKTAKIPSESKKEEQKVEVMSKKPEVVPSSKPKEEKTIVAIQIPEQKKDAKDKSIEELSNKYQSLSKELNELKVGIQIKSKELEQAKKENQDIKAQLGNSEKGYVPESTHEMRRLNDELQKLKGLNKNREEVVEELEKKNSAIAEFDTKIKLLQNELEIEKNTKERLNTKTLEWQEKIDILEKKFEALKLNNDEILKIKEEKEAELEGKLEILQKKILTKTEESTEDHTEDTQELINLTLEDIRSKLKLQNAFKKEEASVRQELLGAYRKLAEQKIKNEADIFEITVQNSKKIEELKEKQKAQMSAMLKGKSEAIEKLRRKIPELAKEREILEIEADKAKVIGNKVEQQKKIIQDMAIQVEMHEKGTLNLQSQLKTLSESISELELQYAVTKDKAYKAQGGGFEIKTAKKTAKQTITI